MFKTRNNNINKYYLNGEKWIQAINHLEEEDLCNKPC